MSPFVFAVAAALGNIVGALAVVRHERRSLQAIDAGLAFGAGFMLAVALLGVMPEVLKDDSAPALYVLSAISWFTWLSTCSRHISISVRRRTRSPRPRERRRCSGLTLHTFFDGVAIASGFLVSGQLGMLLFLAVLLHKLPEGVTIASVMVAGGRPRGSAIGGAAVLGLATILGVLLTERVAPLARHGLAIRPVSPCTSPHPISSPIFRPAEAGSPPRRSSAAP